MSLEERVDRIESTLEILALEAEYARSWDTGDALGWAAIFCEDGVFEMAAAGRAEGRRVEGRLALADFCREINESRTGLHLFHNPAIVVDGDRAQGRIHFEFVSAGSTSPTSTMQGRTVGYYEVAYARTREGWRIAHRFEKAVLRGHSEYYGI